MRFIDRTGCVFGDLTVLYRAANRGKHAYWACECVCGRIAEVKGDHLKSGAIHSCGCDNRRKSSRHSISANGRPSPTYKSWQSMIERTSNPKHQAWRYYGGRGITVCDEWRTFANFLADMGERPDGLSLDRIDNDGDYRPRNCRWATTLEQNNNKRQRTAA